MRAVVEKGADLGARDRSGSTPLMWAAFNETGDAATEYLSAGLTESLIDRLSRLPSLKVMARGTVFRFKGVTDPQEKRRRIGHDRRNGRRLDPTADRRSRSRRRRSTIVVHVPSEATQVSNKQAGLLFIERALATSKRSPVSW